MRTLQQITDAARRNEEVTEKEALYAICAYDVLLAQLELEQDVPKLTKFMTAAEMDPQVYIGRDNDPYNLDAVAWHKAFINIDKDLTE